LVATLLALASAAHASSSRSTAAHAPLRAPSASALASIGCCSDPDVQNFGFHIDFNSIPEDSEITTQYRSHGILFGKAASSLAARSVVRTDYARATGCNRVLNGDPAFSGWEFFIFVDPVQSKWAAVQNVGVDIGYCDSPNSCFIAAYDWNDSLIEAKFNDDIGFQFLSIQRPGPEICKVLVGDCVGTNVCDPDPAGSALNCLSFSTPSTTTRTLPSQVTMPAAPIVYASPGVEPWGMAMLAAALLIVGAWVLRRKAIALDRGQ
jgi:hypothetical protein